MATPLECCGAEWVRDFTGAKVMVTHDEDCPKAEDWLMRYELQCSNPGLIGIRDFTW